jgi:hypothetical protein
MRKILISLAAAVVVIVLAAILLIAYVINIAAPKQGEMVSLSAPPEGDTGIAPTFRLCDTIPCSCACDDPFDPRTIPDTGVYRGLCLNTCHLRSAKLLDAAALGRYGYFAPEEDAGVRYAANLYHGDSATGTAAFYAGRIPLDGIAEVLFQVEHAGGVQGHAQLRFIFAPDKPVLLVPQRMTARRCTLRVWDLYYSVEANGPPGVPYKGDYGFRQEYFQTYRLTTQYSRASRIIRELHHRVWQYRIALTARQKRNVMAAALEQASSAHPNERYHTTRNNCVLALFRVLDNARPVPWYRRPLMLITDNTLFMPTRAPRHLKYRGLADSDEARFHVQNLETEFGWGRFIDESLYTEKQKND